MGSAPHPVVPPVRPIAALVLVLSLAALAAGAPGMDALRAGLGRLTGETSPVCAFRARTGLDCIGCGGTRAFGHVARARLPAAFRANALGAAVGLVTWATVFCAATAWITKRRRALAILAGAAATLLPLVLLVHAVMWWRALPPGVDWQ